MNLGKKLFATAIAAAALAVSAGSASANSIIISYLGTTGSGPYSWNYSADLGGTFGLGGTVLHSGDYFVMPDIGGLVSAQVNTVNGGSTTDWTISFAPQTNLYVGAFSPTEDSALFPNVVFTYSGADRLNDVSALVTFSIISTLDTGSGAKHVYAGNDHKTSDDSQQTNLGQVNSPSAVPVPAAAWSGMGLLGLLGGVQALRRRSISR